MYDFFPLQRLNVIYKSLALMLILQIFFSLHVMPETGNMGTKYIISKTFGSKEVLRTVASCALSQP